VGYEIEQSADGVADWEPVDPERTQITGTSATIDGFQPGEQVSFRLRAFADRPSWLWDDRYRSADTPVIAAKTIGAQRAIDSDGDGASDGDEAVAGGDAVDSQSIAGNDPWRARVEFKTILGTSAPQGEQLKETKILRLPDSIPLPATLIARWAVDDVVRVHGKKVSGTFLVFREDGRRDRGAQDLRKRRR